MAALRGNWDSLLAEASRVSRQAVELSALSANELPALTKYLADEGRPDFGYVSLHGPVKGWDAPANELVDALGVLAPLAGGIVMHPETLGDVAAYRALGPSLLL